jgi:hypothetical protein
LLVLASEDKENNTIGTEKERRRKREKKEEQERIKENIIPTTLADHFRQIIVNFPTN